MTVSEISSLSLKSIVIEIGGGCNCNKVLSSQSDICNVLCSCEFKISPPKLELFSYKGCVAEDYMLEELPSIKSSSICCFSTVSSSEYARLWSKVLDGFHMVEILKICGVCIKVCMLF